MLPMPAFRPLRPSCAERMDFTRHIHTASDSEPRRLGELVALGYALGALGMLAVLLMLARGHAVLALVLASLLTVVVTAIIRPRAYRIAAFIGLFMLPFIAVVDALHPQDFNWPFYWSAFVLALVAVGVLQWRPLPRTWGTLYLGYLVAAGFAYFALRDDMGSFPDLVYILLAFGMYVLVRRADRSERRLLVGLLLGLGVVEALIGCLQSLRGWPVFPLVAEQLFASSRNYFAYVLPGVSTTAVQGSGTFSHFNGLGAVLVAVLPLAFGWWLGRLASPGRIAVMIVIGSGVVTTYSRGALLGSLAGCLLVLAYQRGRSRRALVLLICCVGLVAALLVASTAAQYYVATQNVDVRTETWALALNTAAESPSNLVFGFGYTYFHARVLSPDATARVVHTGTMASLHSGPLQLLLEFGIVGTLLFIMWLLRAYRRGLGGARTAASIACLGGATGFLVHQTFDTSLFAYQGVLFVMLLALAEAETDPQQPGSAFDDETSKADRCVDAGVQAEEHSGIVVARP
jgi:O-antigen ligase